MSQRLQVAVLVDSSTGWGRRLILGVLQHARTRPNWQIWVEPWGRNEHLHLPSGWSGQGIIARVASSRMAEMLHSLGVPIVNVSGLTHRGPTFPRVTTDPDGSTRLAAEHFLDRGFRHFGYFGALRFPASRAHFESFTAAVAKHGPCARYAAPPSSTRFDALQSSLAEWLIALPKPVAVLCWGLGGLKVLDACRAAQLDVPGEVAVLSGDYDDLHSEAAAPPLSGIETPSDLIGREAAALLDEMMAGEAPSRELIHILPTRVITRQSTDVLAIDDPDVSAAVQYIRQHTSEPIDTDDVLSATLCSRRSLERKFEQYLGRTPAMEIRRVHIDRAKQLLLETDLPIPRVATASGFTSPEYLSQAFKLSVGVTPLKFRQRFRAVTQF